MIRISSAYDQRKTAVRRRWFISALGCCLLGVLTLPAPQHADAAMPDPELARIIDNGGYMVRGDGAAVSFREQDLFIPASTLKILTSLVALERLGRDYRFATHFFIDKKNNLFIKGYGDPTLTSEVVLKIGHILAGKGVRQLSAIYLDADSFALNGQKAAEENSANPYDAPNGALAVNFNAVPVQIGKDLRITSGEPQTPLLSLMGEAAENLSSGRHRINVNTLPSQGQLTPALRYAGELFFTLFRQAGIKVSGYTVASVPQALTPIYIHYSEALTEIIRICLKNSNNFIANQIFLICGAKAYGLPATWEKSRRVFNLFIEQSLSSGRDKIVVEEGSGLSRKNKMSPAALLEILDLFKPYSTLLKRQDNILLKSGTMQDVYCYAGYFLQKDRLFPYAVLLNQQKNTRHRVLEILHKAVAATSNQ